MAKTTGWNIGATEGQTVDDRTITAAWIKEMAETYSVDEYTALVWPEHSRSSWDIFNGNNWGVIDALKAEKRAGKWRLLYQLTPNQYLLNANQRGQKLFVSIEPKLNYKGTGKAYLVGMAVTDSPASTGTTRLKFSIGEQVHEGEYSLEPLDLSDCDDEDSTAFHRFFSAMRDFLPSLRQRHPFYLTRPHNPRTPT
ncbi:GPO family capsid scaffolding protein [Enterovibrio sp. Hal110]